ncbi:hypothetical protein [Frankia sp. Cr2]|uniref:hypothetical protein n=1 Tax=Frankia sp. Cr2 TaxID=3073932 RepID=UPI002AD3630C|nr:hypothetical protein [Frankia sp. Cr2]
MRTRLPLVATLLTATLGVIVLVATGCSGDSQKAAPTGGTGATAGAAPVATGAASLAGNQGTVDGAVATRTTSFRAPGGGAGTIDVGFVGLKVDGRLATLTVVWTPRYASSPQNKEISVFEMFAAHSPAMTLVDSVNLKRYFVVQDSHNVELGASGPKTKTVNNTPVSASYTFAAPPVDVRTVDVYADDRLLFDDAPVSR